MVTQYPSMKEMHNRREKLKEYLVKAKEEIKGIRRDMSNAEKEIKLINRLLDFNTKKTSEEKSNTTSDVPQQ